MKNLFVSYEIAKQLKEKGFDELCCASYSTIPNEHIEDGDHKQHLNFCLYWDLENHIKEGYTNTLKAPLYQQAEQWLFKEYNIFIEIKRIKVMADPEDDLYVYYCEIGNFSSQHYKMPKQALRKGIEEALKLIKDK